MAVLAELARLGKSSGHGTCHHSECQRPGNAPDAQEPRMRVTDGLPSMLETL
jgi:hypothetical protein